MKKLVLLWHSKEYLRNLEFLRNSKETSLVIISLQRNKWKNDSSSTDAS